MNDEVFLKLMKESGVKEVDKISTTNFIDTGSYALNALLSGSIYGGIPGNRVTMWAGVPSAGKSFMALACVKTYMDQHPDAHVLYFDTEFALEEDMVANRGIDVKRFHIIETTTLQDFRSKITKILDTFEKSKAKIDTMIVLDSLTQMPTNKEVGDSLNDNDARDMTKAQIIRSIFRIITNKLGSLNIPMQCTAHVYSSMDMYSPVVISGGSGGIYSASAVITLNKVKLKDGAEVIGNIIRATTYKSRYSKESQKVELKLDFKKGLDRYYGLLPIAEAAKIIQKEGRKYKLADGRSVWSKEILAQPSKVFTKDILDLIDIACQEKYKLGGESYDEPDDLSNLDDDFDLDQVSEE